MKSELIPRGEKEAGCEPPLERRAKQDWDGNVEGRLKAQLPTGWRGEKPSRNSDDIQGAHEIRGRWEQHEEE